METKLTLKLDAAVIQQAKQYAKQRGESISRLVEEYFKGLGSPHHDTTNEIHPLVKEISGIIQEIDTNNFKDDYIHYLEKKYD